MKIFRWTILHVVNVITYIVEVDYILKLYHLSSVPKVIK